MRCDKDLAMKHVVSQLWASTAAPTPQKHAAHVLIGNEPSKPHQELLCLGRCPGQTLDGDLASQPQDLPSHYCFLLLRIASSKSLVLFEQFRPFLLIRLLGLDGSLGGALFDTHALVSLISLGWREVIHRHLDLELAARNSAYEPPLMLLVTLALIKPSPALSLWVMNSESFGNAAILRKAHSEGWPVGLSAL